MNITKENLTKLIAKLVGALINLTFHYTGLYFVVVGYLHQAPFKLALGGILFIESTISMVGDSILTKLDNE